MRHPLIRSPLMASLAVMIAAGGAKAADQPSLGPPPAWVKPSSFSQTPPKSDANAPVSLLLRDLQVKFTPDDQQSYLELAAKVLTPQGLQASLSHGDYLVATTPPRMAARLVIKIGRKRTRPANSRAGTMSIQLRLPRDMEWPQGVYSV